MVRQITSRSSLEGLKREAKRWLKALQAGDREARGRFDRAHPKPPQAPTLRDVQHALAREFGLSGWTQLKAELEREQRARQNPALTALLRAAGAGDAPEVARILDEHPTVIDERGTLDGHSGLRTALHFGSHNKEVVRTLLERGANPNIRDEGDDAFPLHFVAERGDLDIVKLLVEHGADTVGEGTEHELNVLGWAVCWDYVHHVAVAEYLLAHGARHTIHTAVALGDVDAIRDVVARAPSDVDKPMDDTNHFRRPLHLAVIKGHVDALRTLLDLGADMEARDAVGLTPLDQAALKGEQEMARLLIDRGAIIDLPAAIVLDRQDVVDRLLGANPDLLKPGHRWGALIVDVAGYASGALIERLIRLGASPNAIDDPKSSVDQTSGYTALHAAAFKGNRAAVEVLLRHGANVRARDSKYCGTPAGWASYANHPDIVEMILEGPVDIFDAIDFDRPHLIPDLLRNDAGAIDRPFGEYANCQGAEWLRAKNMTPLEFAKLNDKTEAVRILLEHGAGTAVPHTARGDR